VGVGRGGCGEGGAGQQGGLEVLVRGHGNFLSVVVEQRGERTPSLRNSGKICSLIDSFLRFTSKRQWLI
jgi:hypothetical protein